jgi:hypothetical protein
MPETKKTTPAARVLVTSPETKKTTSSRLAGLSPSPSQLR